jgi:hypothetical protein
VRGSGTGSWSWPDIFFLAGLRPWRSRSVLRGESTTTYASSKLNRVGRRAARYDSGLKAHKSTGPAHKRPTPHRIAHGQIACSRSRYGNVTNDGIGDAYFYDAENRVIQVNGTLGNCATAWACYVYDAEGRFFERFRVGVVTKQHRENSRWSSRGGFNRQDCN